MPKGNTKIIAKSRGRATSPKKSKGDAPSAEFIVTLDIYVKDAANGNGIAGAVVEVDPRSGGHEDPDPVSTTTPDGLADFGDLSTNGAVIYDIDVTHPSYFSDYKRLSCTSGGPVTVYFYLEHT